MTALQQASTIQIDYEDYDQVDYLHDLYENILSACTGFVHGLKGDDSVPGTSQLNHLNQHLAFICGLIIKVAGEKDKPDAVVRNACGLIGDLITSLVTCNTTASANDYAMGLNQLLANETLIKMLQEARANRNSDVKTVAVWSLREIKKVKTIVANSNRGGQTNNLVYNPQSINNI